MSPSWEVTDWGMGSRLLGLERSPAEVPGPPFLSLLPAKASHGPWPCRGVESGDLIVPLRTFVVSCHLQVKIELRMTEVKPQLGVWRAEWSMWGILWSPGGRTICVSSGEGAL